MKINYFQLETHLANQLAPIYIVSGEELFLKQDAVNSIRKAAKKSGFNERIRLTEVDEEELYSEFNSVSLFAEKRLFELDFRESFPHKNIAKILQEYAENPVSDTMLIMNMGKVDDKVAKSAWYKNLEKKGISLPIWPISREQLPQWIIKRARKYKLQFNSNALNLLADFIEGNLIAAAQAIEKIYLLKPQKIIDDECIKMIIIDESHFNIFDFIDSLIFGDTSRALHILETLKSEGIEPIFILWGITRELRLLETLANEVAKGMDLEQLLQQQRIFSRRQMSIRRFLGKFTVKDCTRFLTYAAEIDNIIKGGVSRNVWNELQLFCLRMG